MRKVSWVILLIFWTFIGAGCDFGAKDLHLKIQYDGSSGLTVGDPVVFNNQEVGKVTAVESSGATGEVVSIAIPQQSAGVATIDSKFITADNPAPPGRKRIEIEQARADGQRLAEGSIVRGTIRSSISSPFGGLFKSFTDVLGSLKAQLDSFQVELQQLPNSEKARQLQDEWRRLQTEMQRVASSTDESLRKQVMPQLQRQFEDLKKKLAELKQ